MTNWQQFWTDYPKTVGNDEYQKQVHNTIKGQGYPQEAFQQVVSRISTSLDLQKDDVLLDLCCGNGLITVELAKRCQEVVGVDFSEPLLEVANRVHLAENISYQRLDILQLNTLVKTQSKPFNKILLHAALQHFQPNALKTILQNIVELSSEPRLILLSNVTDKSKKWNFFNTPQRKFLHMYYKFSGQDRIGTWWDKKFIKRICQELHLNCEFSEESVDQLSSHYRFDVKIY